MTGSQWIVGRRKAKKRKTPATRTVAPHSLASRPVTVRSNRALSSASCQMASGARRTDRSLPGCCAQISFIFPSAFFVFWLRRCASSRFTRCGRTPVLLSVRPVISAISASPLLEVEKSQGPIARPQFPDRGVEQPESRIGRSFQVVRHDIGRIDRLKENPAPFLRAAARLWRGIQADAIGSRPTVWRGDASHLACQSESDLAAFRWRAQARAWVRDAPALRCDAKDRRGAGDEANVLERRSIEACITGGGAVVVNKRYAALPRICSFTSILRQAFSS